MLDHIVFGTARLIRDVVNTAYIVEANTKIINTISNTTAEVIEEPNLEVQYVENDWAKVDLLGQ